MQFVNNSAHKFPQITDNLYFMVIGCVDQECIWDELAYDGCFCFVYSPFGFTDVVYKQLHMS